jgi:hypothetical protein
MGESTGTEGGGDQASTEAPKKKKKKKTSTKKPKPAEDRTVPRPASDFKASSTQKANEIVPKKKPHGAGGLFAPDPSLWDD